MRKLPLRHRISFRSSVAPQKTLSFNLLAAGRGQTRVLRNKANMPVVRGPVLGRSTPGGSLAGPWATLFNFVQIVHGSRSAQSLQSRARVRDPGSAGRDGVAKQSQLAGRSRPGLRKIDAGRVALRRRGNLVQFCADCAQFPEVHKRSRATGEFCETKPICRLFAARSWEDRRPAGRLRRRSNLVQLCADCARFSKCTVQSHARVLRNKANLPAVRSPVFGPCHHGLQLNGSGREGPFCCPPSPESRIYWREIFLRAVIPVHASGSTCQVQLLPQGNKPRVRAHPG